MKNLLITVLCIIVLNAKGQDKEVVNNSLFGVPSSPAFELLPDKPAEVTHITTPRDFTSFVPTVVDGKKLKTGVGFDFRPFNSMVGSLRDYQRNKLKQILWRTVASAGTAGKQDSDDAYLSVGIRIPIIDRGDSRADRTYTDMLENIVTSEADQPEWEDSLCNDHRSAIVAAMNRNVAAKLKAARDRYTERHWNSFRLDVGYSYIWLLKEASIKSNNIQPDRNGLWIAASVPLGRRMQWVTSVKNAWVSTDADHLETGRTSAGARFRYFATYFALSVEYAMIWSNYDKQESLNESWHHFGALLEIPVPRLKGVVGLTYGGDTSRRDAPDARLAFNYSIYTDRILER